MVERESSITPEKLTGISSARSKSGEDPGDRKRRCLFTPQDAKRLVEETGCDGSWWPGCEGKSVDLFKQITHYLETGELLPRPSVEELKAMILAPWSDDDGV